MQDILEIKNISDLNRLTGQPEPLHPLISVVDFSKVSFLQQSNVKITTSFYSILSKNLCPGALKYGRNYYDFQEGSLFFMGPNQVVKIEDPDETQDVYGWGLFFHPDLIRGTSLGARMKEYSFFSYSTYEALHVSEIEKQKLANIVGDLESELQHGIDKHSKTLMVSTIELLLNYCNRFYDRQFITRTETNKDVIVDFEHTIDAYFGSDQVRELGFPSIRYFADQLHLSPNYLSDLLKKETGKNGTEHIQLIAIERAKEKLLNSRRPVSEIAYELGFEYPQYFSKMFKKRTGTSPAEYRKAN